MNLTSMFKIKDINNKIKANDQSALLGKVPITVLPMSVVNLLVKVDAGETKFLGNKAALPITICTAKASPKARAIQKIIAVKIPGTAALKTTL